MKISSLLLIVVLAAGELFAQDTKPAPPYIAEVPDGTRWAITTRPRVAARDGETPKGTQVTVYKSGSWRREVTIYSMGGKAETFTVKGLAFKQPSGFAPGDVFVTSAGSTGDFPELSWVNADSYVRTESEGGKKFHVYAWVPPVRQAAASGEMVQVAPARNGVSGANVTEAWIDAVTRLPVRIVQPRIEKVYQFGKASAKDAEPEGDIRRRVEAYFDGTIPR